MKVVKSWDQFTHPKIKHNCHVHDEIWDHECVVEGSWMRQPFLEVENENESPISVKHISVNSPRIWK